LSENVLLTVYCVVFGGVNSLRSGPAGSTQYTVNSTFSLNYKVQT
jgi:hypothetical protein